ncbi:MAG: PRC-barrel domain-containing protein [Candidatus Marsarchaeota archaeon]|jgi:sporulation protein YlmC with PRC-barrel domain|nr:PRC-barrel domain-containing protein [Candidatus Marsarchaeota archaeon]
MSVNISELYEKQIISNEGKILGKVKGVMLNLEDGTVSHLLLTEVQNIERSKSPREELRKSSVAFKRVRKIAETIIVGKEEQ